MKKYHDHCECKECRKKHIDHCKKIDCDFVKDRVCCDFSVPKGKRQDVYVTTDDNVYASGFVSYDCGEAEFIEVRIYDESDKISGPIKVYKESCLAFTASEFTRIEVKCSGKSGHSRDQCEGKICLTPRYQVKCEKDD